MKPSTVPANAAPDDEDLAIGSLIDQAWNEHAGDPSGVASRLGACAEWAMRAPGRSAEIIALAEHVLVGHLADSRRMGESLEALAGHAADGDARAALDRARLAMALLDDERAEGPGLTVVQVVRAHGSAAYGKAETGRVDAARSLLRRAGEKAQADGTQESSRAMAAIHNNLAAQLLEGAADAARDTLMMESAREARRRWGEAGTWLQAERAEYLLAHCAAKIGDSTSALSHAGHCLMLCEANGADPLEFAFAHEARAVAARAAGDPPGFRDAVAKMGDCVDRIDDAGNREWARAALGKLSTSGYP